MKKLVLSLAFIKIGNYPYFLLKSVNSLINIAMIVLTNDVMQGKLSQKCRHLLYCSVLSHGGNVNTRRTLQPDVGSIFHIKNQ